MCTALHAAFLLIFVYKVECFLYDVENAQVVRMEGASSFGYSVFLQQNDPSILLVGAPKQNKSGIAYACNAEGSPSCKAYYAPNEADSFFGGTIGGGSFKGEPIAICSPLYTTRHQYSGEDNLFANGACYLYSYLSSLVKENEIKPLSQHNEQLRDNQYHYAFGQLGFSADYVESHGEFLLGAPGISTWKGMAVRLFQSENVLPPQSRQTHNTNRQRTDYTAEVLKRLDGKFYDYDYAGYSVTSGEFVKGRTFYVLGVPRGSNLRGMVYILEKNDFIQPTKLQGDALIGSYFGASVCAADVNGDGFEDLLVGAPMRRTQSYNDGSVYEYISDQKGGFRQNKIITPEGRTGHFGTAIANLGKVTLDGYDSVIISSPFENHGSGALYLYVGSKEGLKLNRKIQVANVAFLGFSLSRAVDVDYNGFVDIAAGGLKSNSAVIFKSKQVFKYILDVTSDARLYSYKENQPFEVTYCVKVETLPSQKKLQVATTIVVEFDGRLENRRLQLRETINLGQSLCKTVQAKLREKNENFRTSLEIKLSVSEDVCPTCPVSSPTYPKSKDLKLPFLFDCGSDQICTPDLDITTSLDGQEHIVGSTTNLKLLIDVNNNDEYAYLCRLNLTLPPVLQVLSAPKTCNARGCTLANPLERDSLEFVLDVGQLNEVVPSLQLEMDVACLNYTTKHSTRVQLTYKSTFSAEGSHSSVLYKNKTTTTDVKATYKYSIQNRGPSFVLNKEFIFRVPRRLKTLNNEEIFSVYEPKVQGTLVQCKSNMNYSEESTAETEGTIKAAQILSLDGGSDKITCQDSNVECMQITCLVQRLSKNEQVNVAIPIKSHINRLLRFTDSSSFNVTADVMFTHNSKSYTAISSVTLLDNIKEKYVSIFWIIFGVVVGLLLLAAIVYALYKFNFFKRPSYDKMQEQNVETTTEELHELAEKSD